jgi:hypothetical protein
MCYLAAVLSYGSLGRFDDADVAGQKAIHLVEQSDNIDHVQAMKAYGEITILSLRSSRTRESAIAAFPLWDKAMYHMFAAGARDDNWKDSFVIFGHVHGFLVTTATTGTPPNFACDGSQSVDPFLGIFFRTSAERIQMYHDASIPDIMWLHSRYAKAAGDALLAKEWLLKADSLIDQGPVTSTTAPIRMDMVPQYLLNDKYAEAIDAGFESGRSMVATRCYYQKHTVSIPHETTVESLMKDLDDESKKLTDPFGIINGAIPAFFRIAFLAFEDRLRAASDSRSVAALCLQIAPNAEQPKVWQQAAKLFDGFASSISDGESIRISDYADACREIQILSYFAGTFTQELQSVFTAHVIGLAHVDSWYSENLGVYTELVSPFINDFWRQAFAKRRFEFSNPRIVEQDLREIEQSPPKNAARSILKAVSASFSTRHAGDCARSLHL